MVKALDIFLITCLVFSLSGLVFVILNDKECEVCQVPIVEEEKPMVDARVYDWARNSDNLEKMWFSYWIYNYGDVEAKDVFIKCDLLDGNSPEIKIVSGTDNIGNVASNSMVYGTVDTNYPEVKSGMKFSAVCYVEKCSNCEILYKHIPKLAEVYK